MTPLWRTAEWGYVRLHEGTGVAEAGVRAARPWRRGSTAWTPPGRSAAADVFVYFNNDRGAAAMHNARTLSRMAPTFGVATTAAALSVRRPD